MRASVRHPLEEIQLADLIASSGDLADSRNLLQPAPESVFDPTFVLPPHTASDFVTADYRWTDTAGTSSGNTTLALGATGGVVTWSVAGAGLSNQAGGSFFTGSTVDMGSFIQTLRQHFGARVQYQNSESRPIGGKYRYRGTTFGIDGGEMSMWIGIVNEEVPLSDHYHFMIASKETRLSEPVPQPRATADWKWAHWSGLGRVVRPLSPEQYEELLGRLLLP